MGYPIPKQFIERIEELKSQLRLSIVFNDKRRIEYLQHQISALEEKIETRKHLDNKNE